MKEGRFYSEEAKQIMVEKISTGNFTSLANAAKSISKRPEGAESRVMFGHWEGYTVAGGRGDSPSPAGSCIKDVRKGNR